MGTPNHKLWDRVYESTDWVRLKVARKMDFENLRLIAPPNVELRAQKIKANGSTQYLIEARSLR